jgi:hypothetical protein
MYRNEIGWESVDCVYLAQDKAKRQCLARPHTGFSQGLMSGSCDDRSTKIMVKNYSLVDRMFGISVTTLEKLCVAFSIWSKERLLRSHPFLAKCE